jgi:hypothetical protein
MNLALTPPWLIRSAVAAVWMYEGLWCKLLRRSPHEFVIVAAVPYFGPRIGTQFLLLLGTIEVALSLWTLTGAAAVSCAVVQTLLLVALNGNGLLWARRLMTDPAGMILKNFAFLVLVWVAS